MKTPTLSNASLETFTCSLEKDSLNSTFYELLHSVFGSSSGRNANCFNFSHAFSKAIEDLVLSGEEIDRGRTILITAQRNLGSVKITFSYRPLFEGDTAADRCEVSINYPLLK